MNRGTKLLRWSACLASIVLAIAPFAVSTTSAAAAGASAGVAAGASDKMPLSVDSPQYKRGRLLYIQCRACHELQAGGVRKVGPHLAGIVGRSAAAVSDFAYSEALESAGLTWDAANLDRFLKRPSEVVPGNTMAFAGMANDADRAALIAFLTVESRQSAAR